MNRSIAVIEDEDAIRENYVAALERQGYRVMAYSDRPEAMAAFEHGLPDLVLIDISLKDEPEGGFDLCRDLRAKSESLPIIFLTARDSDLDKISGLRLGADDYLTKDISMQHLSARIVALFRRHDALLKPVDIEKELIRGQLTIQPDRMRILWSNQSVSLTITEYWLVYALARYPGHIKNRDQLMQDASILVDDTTITSHIKRIRKKFKVTDNAFDSLETVYGYGYRWHE